MRKSIAILSLSALFMGSAAFAAYPYIRTNGNGKQWSDIDAWKKMTSSTTSEALEKAPNGKDDQITLNYNFKDIYMDMDVTLNSLMFNRDLGSAWRDMGKDPNANPTIYMGETVTDGDGLRDATLTLDLANKSLNSYVLYPAIGDSVVYGINAFTHTYTGTGEVYKVMNMNLTFEGGTIKVTDSANTGTRTAFFSMRPEGDKDFTGRTYGYTFNSFVESTENLSLEGRLNSQADNGGVFKFTFNKDLTLFNGDDATDQHKILTLTATSVPLTYDAAGNIEKAGNYAVIGENAMAVVRRITLENNTALQIDGVLSTQKASDKRTTNIVSSGALLIVNGTFDMAGSLSIYGKTVINGILDGTTRSIDDPYVQVFSNGEMVIGKNAQKVSLGRTGLRLYKGAKLSIDSASAFDDNSTRIWFFKPNTVTDESAIVEFNANAKLLGFSWQDKTSVVFKFAEDVEVLLKTFSLNEGNGSVYHGLKGDVSLTLEGYRNGMIRITSLDKQDLDDLTLIKAAGFEDGSFHWEFDDASNSYWLVGTAAVPEPATVAAVFGLAALGFALSRRRR